CQGERGGGPGVDGLGAWAWHSLLYKNIIVTASRNIPLPVTIMPGRSGCPLLLLMVNSLLLAFAWSRLPRYSTSGHVLRGYTFHQALSRTTKPLAVPPQASQDG